MYREFRDKLNKKHEIFLKSHLWKEDFQLCYPNGESMWSLSWTENTKSFHEIQLEWQARNLTWNCRFNENRYKHITQVEWKYHWKQNQVLLLTHRLLASDLYRKATGMRIRNKHFYWISPDLFTEFKALANRE